MALDDSQGGLVQQIDQAKHLVPESAAFRNPHSGAGAWRASTSGTTGPRRAVPYGWELFAEEADAERLLLEAHGLGRAPVALWLPAPPGIAGLHNAALHWRFERPLARWDSQTPLPGWRDRRVSRTRGERSRDGRQCPKDPRERQKSLSARHGI